MWNVIEKIKKESSLIFLVGLFLFVLIATATAAPVNLTACGTYATNNVEYVIPSNITQTDQNCIILNGNNITINGNWSTVIINDTGWAAFLFNGTNIRVENVSVQCNNATSTNSAGLRYSAPSTNISSKYIDINGCYYGMFCASATGANNTLTSVNINGSLYRGILESAGCNGGAFTYTNVNSHDTRTGNYNININAAATLPTDGGYNYWTNCSGSCGWYTISSTTNITASADTYTDSAQPTTNYNGATSVPAAITNNVWIQFNASSTAIPANMFITHMEPHMWIVCSAGGGCGARTWHIYNATTWNSATVTWNTQPAETTFISQAIAFATGWVTGPNITAIGYGRYNYDNVSWRGGNTSIAFTSATMSIDLTGSGHTPWALITWRPTSGNPTSYVINNLTIQKSMLSLSGTSFCSVMWPTGLTPIITYTINNSVVATTIYRTPYYGESWATFVCNPNTFYTLSSNYSSPSEFLIQNTTCPSEQLTNPSFNENSSGWTIDGSTQNITGSLCNTPNGCVKTGNTYQTISQAASRTYTFSAYVKASASNILCSPFLWNGTAANCQSSTTSTSWTRLSANCVMNLTGTVSALLWSNTSSGCYYDDISLMITDVPYSNYSARFSFIDEISENSSVANSTSSVISNITSQVDAQINNSRIFYVCHSSLSPDYNANYTNQYKNQTTQWRFKNIPALNSTLANVWLYMLDNSQAQTYTFIVQNVFNYPIENATINFYHYSYYQSAWIMTDNLVTDYTGTGTVFLQPFSPYIVTVSAPAYIALNYSFTPSTTTTIYIKLYQNGTIFTLPDYENMFDDTSYLVTPNTYYHINETNATFQLVANSPVIEYYGMNITKYFNGSTTTVYTNNITILGTGGLLNYTANQTGIYTQCVWFKHMNYSEFSPMCNKFFVSNGTAFGLANIYGLLSPGTLISPFGFLFLALCCTMLGAGFVARYSINGAAIVGLVILIGFTVLWPSAEVVCVTNGGCVQMWMSTVLTTIMVMAALVYQTVY